MTIRLSFILCFVILFSACNSPRSTKKVEDFDAFVDNYVANLRWSRFNEAASLHVNKEGVRAEVDLKRLKPIRVTGHQMREKILSPEFDIATVVFTMSFYNNDFGTLKEEEVTLEMWYSEEAKGWLIESDFPKFK